MSNIYIQEPPTKGKVVLKTTVGEIEIELWSKECPKASRNFVQLCMEGYYDGTIFHRVIKDFIAQGGDPTGTGQGGESIYGQPFKDEFHSRLRYTRRGLVGMANAGIDDNGSQFFFTFAQCPELNKKNTLFGKVVGNTIYNMIKLNESETINERPIRPDKIISTEVIYNPFDDIKPKTLRAEPKEKTEDEKSKKVTKGVKNFHLLSFGDEAEDEEQELVTVSKEFRSKAKSAHDIGDPTLLSKPAKENETRRSDDDSSDDSSDNNQSDFEEGKKNDTKSSKPNIENIKSKLKKQTTFSAPDKAKEFNRDKKEVVDDEEKARNTKREEIKKLEKELMDKKKEASKMEEEKKEKMKEVEEQTEVVKKYKDEVQKYEHLKKMKKSTKEDKTLEMLNSFRDRLFKAKKLENPDDNEEKLSDHEKSNENEETLSGFKSILTHRLEVEEEIKNKVIDANIADHERFDIYDPRNPINKRKREESRDLKKDKKKSH